MTDSTIVALMIICTTACAHPGADTRPMCVEVQIAIQLKANEIHAANSCLNGLVVTLQHGQPLTLDAASAACPLPPGHVDALRLALAQLDLGNATGTCVVEGASGRL